jgi:hypothetical protein
MLVPSSRISRRRLFGNHDLWVLCAVLARAHEAANAEHERVSSRVWTADE